MLGTSINIIVRYIVQNQHRLYKGQTVSEILKNILVLPARIIYIYIILCYIVRNHSIILEYVLALQRTNPSRNNVKL